MLLGDAFAQSTCAKATLPESRAGYTQRSLCCQPAPIPLSFNPSAALFPVYLPPHPFAATLTQAKDAVVNTATEAANKASEAAKGAANTASETATQVRWGQAQSLINKVWG